jgi:hypothetical protein
VVYSRALRPSPHCASGSRAWPYFRSVSVHSTKLRNTFAVLACVAGGGSSRREEGKTPRKLAVVAVARKLAVLLDRLWMSGEVYEPLRNSQKATATNSWAQTSLRREKQRTLIRWQRLMNREHPTCTERKPLT